MLKIILIIGLVIGATYLIPKDARQKGTEKLGSLISAVLPQSVKEKIKPVIFSPAERRQKLLGQLNANIEDIKKNITKTASAKKSEEDTEKTSKNGAEDEQKTTEEILQKLEETKEIIKKIEEANTEQGAINKITTKVYKSVGGGTETTETCPCKTE